MKIAGLLVGLVLFAGAGWDATRPCKIIDSQVNWPSIQTIATSAHPDQLAVDMVADYDKAHPWYTCLTDKR